MTGDTYKRRKVSDDAYQCGCKWERREDVGDVLVQCPIHQQATESRVVKFEQEERKYAAT